MPSSPVAVLRALGRLTGERNDLCPAEAQTDIPLVAIYAAAAALRYLRGRRVDPEDYLARLRKKTPQRGNEVVYEAEQGHAAAQFNLAICFYVVSGVDKDVRKTVEWLIKAAQQGHPRGAQLNLACR